MEGHCSTGQSPQWAVVPVEEEEEEERKNKKKKRKKKKTFSLRFTVAHFSLTLYRRSAECFI